MFGLQLGFDRFFVCNHVGSKQPCINDKGSEKYFNNYVQYTFEW